MFVIYDIILIPLCFALLALLFRVIVARYQAEHRAIMWKAFYFKMFCALCYAMIMGFYYGGGDTFMFYSATLGLYDAIFDGAIDLPTALATHSVDNIYHPLASYFSAERVGYKPFYYMRTPSNFFVSRVAIIPTIIFMKSYICVTMTFAFLALGGLIRLYKVAIHYFPKIRPGVAFAILFFPSVAFWSSGVLKDSICMGAIGLLIHSLFCIFIQKRKFVWSIIWLLLSIYILFLVKVYILLALLPGLVIWIFNEQIRHVPNPVHRRGLLIISILISVGFVAYLLNYLTSLEGLRSFQLDRLAESTTEQRSVFENIAASEQGSYFEIQTTNPFLILLNGIFSTFFRPFPWEIRSVIEILSTAEAMATMALLIFFFVKRGFLNFFKIAFRNQFLVMAIIFSLVFSAVVGSASTNFGSLSRYKIPCVPFFMLVIFAAYHISNLPLPRFIRTVLGWIERNPNQNHLKTEARPA